MEVEEARESAKRRVLGRERPKPSCRTIMVFLGEGTGVVVDGEGDGELAGRAT